MDADGAQEKASLFTAMRPAQLMQVIVVGVVVGAFSWIFAQVLGMYALKPASCSGDAFVCAASSQPAVILAAILAGCIGLFGLVKLQIFRPLLIVIAATMSLWGVVGLLTALPWYLSLLATVLFYAVAYTAFMWVARIRTFWLVLVLFVLLIVGVRLIITA